jgi:D-alanyl-D-alanine carboxypeptidase
MRTALLAGLGLAVVLVVGCTSDEHPGAAPPGTDGPARPPATATDRLPADVTTALQAILDGVVADHALTGAAGARGITAAAVTPDGSWTGAAGTDGVGTRLVPRAMMAVDSITKTFVAAEVMQLFAAGRVDVDAPLSRYVRHRLTANGATVRQFLSMRSGVTDPPDRVFEALILARTEHPAQPWPTRRILAFLHPGAGPPTDRPVYANSNYLLLGLLIESVTGRTPGEVARTDLFGPAGLERIVAQDRERPTPPLARPSCRGAARDGYLPSRPVTDLEQDTFAGIAADAATIADWGNELYGGRLLAPVLVRDMRIPPTVTGVAPGIGYGLGTMVFEGLATDVTVGHIGEDPCYTSMLAAVPARHLAVAVLIPQGDREVVPIVRDLLGALP